MGYANLAMTSVSLNDYDEGLRYLNKSLELYMKMDNKVGIGRAYNNIAVIYNKNLGDQKTGMIYLEKALKVFKEAQIGEEEIFAATNLTLAYCNDGNLDKASKVIEPAAKLAFEKNDSTLIHLVLVARGHLRSKQKRHEEAIKDIKKAYEFYIQKGVKFKQAHAGFYLSLAYKNAGKYESSLIINANGIRLSKELNNYPLLADFLEDNYNNYKQLNRHQEALSAYEQMKVIRDSIDQERSESLAEKYELFEKEKSSLELAIEDDKHEKRNQKLIWLLAFISVAGILLYSLFYRQKQMHLKDKEIFDLKEQQLIASQQSKKKEITTLHENISQLELERDAKHVRVKQLEEELKHNDRDKQSTERTQITKKLISFALSTEQDWEKFKFLFETIYPSFFIQLSLSHPNLTDSDLRILTMSKLEFDQDLMSENLGISRESVRKAKYRLKKKLNIDSEIDWTEFLINI